jgi:hypothetical protein
VALGLQSHGSCSLEGGGGDSRNGWSSKFKIGRISAQLPSCLAFPIALSALVMSVALGVGTAETAKLELFSILLSSRNASNVDSSCHEGFPLLTLSACWNIPDVCFHLLSRMKANVNVKDRHGYTPLYYAVAHENTKIVFILLQFGANSSSSNVTYSIPSALELLSKKLAPGLSIARQDSGSFSVMVYGKSDYILGLPHSGRSSSGIVTNPKKLDMLDSDARKLDSSSNDSNNDLYKNDDGSQKLAGFGAASTAALFLLLLLSLLMLALSQFCAGASVGSGAGAGAVGASPSTVARCC